MIIEALLILRKLLNAKHRFILEEWRCGRGLAGVEVYQPIPVVAPKPLTPQLPDSWADILVLPLSRFYQRKIANYFSHPYVKPCAEAEAAAPTT